MYVNLSLELKVTIECAQRFADIMIAFVHRRLGLFFFSSRRRHTIFDCDWSSDVCSSDLYVTSALLSYRAKDTLEFAVGRDPLPTGINLPDLTYLFHAHNRIGYYDAPLQAKLFWWGKRYQITPYAFAPGGPEPSGERESGGGALAEFDVLGKGRTVVGVNALHGNSRNVHRTLVRPYVRLGFGPWGIPAEHDITERKLTASATSFHQHQSNAQ